MELTEDEIIKKMVKTVAIVVETLHPYEYEWGCFSCSYNVKKTKARTL